MAVRPRFSCEECDASPDAITHRTLAGQLLDQRFGTYLDAQPGGWLIFTGGGPLGPRRYACPHHRDALTNHLRQHYGTIRHAHVYASEPHEEIWPDGFTSLDDRELTELLTRAAGRPRH